MVETEDETSEVTKETSGLTSVVKFEVNTEESSAVRTEDSVLAISSKERVTVAFLEVSVV